MNILTAGTQELCASLRSKVDLKEAIFEHNFEQVIGLAKCNELDKLCIFIDVWNCFGMSFNSMRGQRAAEKIHAINPDIPILIWDGREYIPEDPDVVMPPMFQVVGTPKEIVNHNELYLDFENYDEEMIEKITKKFFTENLTEKDVPRRECLSFKF